MTLDHLQDEGALPDGRAWPHDLIHRAAFILHGRWEESVRHEEAIERQEAGGSFIFSGPMWLPLRTLRKQSVASIEDLHIRLG